MGIKSIPNNMNRRLMKDLNNIMKQDTESLGFLIEPKVLNFLPYLSLLFFLIFIFFSL